MIERAAARAAAFFMRLQSKAGQPSKLLTENWPQKLLKSGWCSKSVMVHESKPALTRKKCPTGRRAARRAEGEPTRAVGRFDGDIASAGGQDADDDAEEDKRRSDEEQGEAVVEGGAARVGGFDGSRAIRGSSGAGASAAGSSMGRTANGLLAPRLRGHEEVSPWRREESGGGATCSAR
jgi:hypothetical protein